MTSVPKGSDGALILVLRTSSVGCFPSIRPWHARGTRCVWCFGRVVTGWSSSVDRSHSQLLIMFCHFKRPAHSLLDFYFSTSFSFCEDRSWSTNSLKKKKIVVKAFNLGNQISICIIAFGIFQGELCKCFDGVEMPILHLMFLNDYMLYYNVEYENTNDRI